MVHATKISQGSPELSLADLVIWLAFEVEMAFEAKARMKCPADGCSGDVSSTNRRFMKFQEKVSD